MKKTYVAPTAEKIVFDYLDNVTASNGHKYRKYVDDYAGCRETATDEWFDEL